MNTEFFFSQISSKQTYVVELSLKKKKKERHLIPAMSKLYIKALMI